MQRREQRRAQWRGQNSGDTRRGDRGRGVGKNLEGGTLSQQCHPTESAASILLDQTVTLKLPHTLAAVTVWVLCLPMYLC